MEFTHLCYVTFIVLFPLVKKLQTILYTTECFEMNICLLKKHSQWCQMIEIIKSNELSLSIIINLVFMEFSTKKKCKKKQTSPKENIINILITYLLWRITTNFEDCLYSRFKCIKHKFTFSTCAYCHFEKIEAS